ncbi:Asp-tRNA(Asn)/Glu-tRNA(Gln) amidotransferase subunit GatB [candidate division KSB1 bacterium]|nr:Asp-tRNA(Asn)/Glu-tRNA(Gln) amidotransferase subunit GatB [candidate division KSB1 bacterium]
MTNVNYEPIIGLEIHIQLLTRSKIFCSCSAQFGGVPNTQVCPVCLGMPGVLPVLNQNVVEYALKLGLATDCEINPRAQFARKNYFYPDLPKGYQISQFEQPFCQNGKIDIEMGDFVRSVRLTRIHAEEDAGKSMHAEAYVGTDETLVDVNRCGVPLLELVTEPDIRSPEEAAFFLIHLRQLVRYLGICDGNMEEASLRCDANISLRPRGETGLGTKTELKNMNSFSHVESALNYEISRQYQMLSSGEKIEQETRMWNVDRGITESMRSKEFSHDYRYFPDPDLVPVVVDDDWIERVRRDLPELPLQRKKRFIKEYALPEYDAKILTEDRAIADFFEAVAIKVKDKKAASNWVMGEVLRCLKEKKCNIDELRLEADSLVEIIQLIESGTINSKIAKSVFNDVIESGDSPKKIVKEKGLMQITDHDAIEKAIDQVLQAHPDEVDAFRGGKDKLMGFFVGQVMRATDGKANPKSVNVLIRKKLSGS